jgi:4,5-DOPA dioxygenase extradiol
VAGVLAANDRDALAQWQEQAPEARRAHPTDEHFLPLLVAYGAAGERPRATRVHQSIYGGALSMDAYRFA